MAEEYKKAADGTVTVTVDEKFMEARMSLFPPEEGGRPLTQEIVKKELISKGVLRNADWDKINTALDSGSVVNGLVIAVGNPAEDGENGSIEYAFPTVSELKPQVDEKTGTVDYRELGNIRNIKKGTLIATIKLATKGSPGFNIHGAEILPYPGKEARYSVGTGTILSNDKTKIYAAIDGNLRWDRDRFVVDAKVEISGDVDLSVGNIDFVGDINVRGEVCEGFIIKGKNVTVSGNVTGATIIAGGNVELHSGAIFSNITCGGDFKLSFGENAKINCSGELSAKSLVNCRVMCEGDIVMNGAKSVIVGGEVISYGNITSGIVGSDTYAKTTINLGNSLELMRVHNESKKAFELAQTNYNKLKMLYDQLSALKKVAPLDPEKETILRQAFRYTMTEGPKLQAQRKAFDHEEMIIQNSRMLTLKVKNKIYPGVTVKIFTSVCDNDSECGNCTFYLASDGEVSFRAGD